MWCAARIVNTFIKMSQNCIFTCRGNCFFLAVLLNNTCCFGTFHSQICHAFRVIFFQSTAHLLFKKCTVCSFRCFVQKLETETSVSVTTLWRNSPLELSTEFNKALQSRTDFVVHCKAPCQCSIKKIKQTNSELK